MNRHLIENPAPVVPELIKCASRKPTDTEPCVLTYLHTEATTGCRVYRCTVHHDTSNVWPIFQTTKYTYFAGIPEPVTIGVNLDNRPMTFRLMTS